MIISHSLTRTWLALLWVFCEQRQGALMSTDFELVSEARKLADELGCEVTGLLLGDNV